MKEPIDPDIVLLGLIFVSFLPLKNLPNKSPPMSELIDTNKEQIMNISASKFSDLIMITIKENNDKYNNEIDFKINLYNLSLK